MLFDIGNVLFCDPWEALLLSEGGGLADLHGLDRKRVREVGEALWRRYSVHEMSEDEYWDDVNRALGLDLSPDDVTDLERRVLRPNPVAEQLLTAAAGSGRRLGVASNNTAFWFAKQWEVLGLARYVHPMFVFVSHQHGVEKNALGRGLLDIAAEHVDPSRALLVDDRHENLERAARIGFRTLRYAMDECPAREGRTDPRFDWL